MREYVESGDEMAIRIGGYGSVGVRDDGRIIPAEPDCRVAPDVPIGELFKSALRATRYDAAISRNEKSADN